MAILKRIMLFCSVLFLYASPVFAQYQIINADEAMAWMNGEKKVVVIDARPVGEYRASHIPGAVNIPAETVTAEKSKLPKDKSTSIIFYCRGAG